MSGRRRLATHLVRLVQPVIVCDDVKEVACDRVGRATELLEDPVNALLTLCDGKRRVVEERADLRALLPAKDLLEPAEILLDRSESLLVLAHGGNIERRRVFAREPVELQRDLPLAAPFSASNPR